MTDVTMVYVTHDQVEAMTLTDRICVLRDENVEQVGTPAELYENLNSIFVALHLCGALGDMISMRPLANYAHRFDDDGLPCINIIRSALDKKNAGCDVLTTGSCSLFI